MSAMKRLTPLPRKRAGKRRTASSCKVLRCKRRIATAELCRTHAVARCDHLARAICRSEWYGCARCHALDALQWSHHLSRRFMHTRWLGLNSVMHCAACHAYLTHNPAAHAEWIRGYVGENAYAMLMDEAYGPIDPDTGMRPGARKFTTTDLAEWLLLLEATPPTEKGE